MPLQGVTCVRLLTWLVSLSLCGYECAVGWWLHHTHNTNTRTRTNTHPTRHTHAHAHTPPHQHLHLTHTDTDEDEDAKAGQEEVSRFGSDVAAEQLQDSSDEGEEAAAPPPAKKRRLRKSQPRPNRSTSSGGEPAKKKTKLQVPPTHLYLPLPHTTTITTPTTHTRTFRRSWTIYSTTSSNPPRRRARPKSGEDLARAPAMRTRMKTKTTTRIPTTTRRQKMRSWLGGVRRKQSPSFLKLASSPSGRPRRESPSPPSEPKPRPPASASRSRSRNPHVFAHPGRSILAKFQYTTLLQ